MKGALFRIGSDGSVTAQQPQERNRGMALTPDERELLRQLQEKNDSGRVSHATVASDGGKVVQLFSSSTKQQPGSGVAFLAEFLRRVERGEIQDFVAVGVVGAGVTAAYSKDQDGKVSTQMLGAIEMIKAYVVRSLLPKE